MQGGVRRLVLRNLSLQTIAEGVALACGLASSMILARHLDVDGFGAFNYVFAFMYLFLSLNDLGINTIVVREVSQAPARAGEIIGAAMGLRLTVAAGVLAAAWAAIWLWPMDDSLRAPLSLFALVLPLNALNVPGIIFQTSMRFDLTAAATIVWRVGGLVLVIVTVMAGRGLMAVLAALLVADVIGTAVLYQLARPLVRFRVRCHPATWRLLMASSMPIGASLLLTAVVNRLDFFMLERMVSLEAVGLYSAAYRVTSLLEKFPLLVMATLYPVMSKLALEDAARLRGIYRGAVWRFGVIALPLAAVTTVMAPWLLVTAFGDGYRESATALRYLVWATACLYLAMTGGTLLNSVSRSRDNLLALAAGAAVNVALNVVLIPSRGIEGAAMATAASYALVLLLTGIAVERHFARIEREPVRG